MTTLEKHPRLQPRRSRSAARDQKRSAFRRRLVDAERGMTFGLRGDSTFFVHFFVGSIVAAAGLVFGLSLIEWTVIVLGLTVVFSAEMFHQVLKAILGDLGRHLGEPARNSLRIGTAAVFVTMIGAAVVISLIFGNRLLEMFAG